MSELLEQLQINADYNTLLETNNDTFLYHLSSRRSNWLSVIDFSSSDEVLELSFQCEIITKYYLNKVRNVDKFIIDDEEKQINDILYSSSLNYIDSLSSLNKKYDKIIVTGYLEQCNKHLNVSQSDFIKLLISLLKENGKLYIATSNKYSLRYFSGLKEEYSHNYFDHLLNHSSLLSKKELDNLFSLLNLKSYYYYPLPDYFFALNIYSNDYLPSSSSYKDMGAAYKNDRYILFDEIKGLNEVIKSGDFETFAPSFVIELWN